MIEAGDTVLHKPTGEKWYLLGVNVKWDRVCPAGWPVSMGSLSDCELVEKGKGITPEELEYRNKTYGYNWDKEGL